MIEKVAAQMVAEKAIRVSRAEEILGMLTDTQVNK
jgi:hypothetical protein